MANVIALISGLVFGFGLIIGQMVNPSKILAFLDIAGAWNPSLALVMVGAITVALPAFQFAKKQKKSICGMEMQLPKSQVIDKRLMAGSMAFGVGWGMAGFCPAPALVTAATGQWQALVFSVAMIAGFYLFAVLEKRK